MFDLSSLCKQCPFCESTLFYDSYDWRTCINGCSAYYIIDGKPYVVQGIPLMCKIFDKSYFIPQSLDLFMKEIKYWKENDRYLMRIVVSDSND